ncbi:conjugal transfer protein [Renibacterium salmoninarum ATCC 33209]|uniref:Conjugal transfer protein n=1 Tax=Renibacterium salmoninarum (strain ATCC 33209 / DSM 20767 / JCM 11484 / NBRC 15589 / NCIMB 2235) TaxID=288705 RepID=A9WP81_RENSM|nr:conjugal transfer protein [Renibacterium salmoninarum ATCC 33209]
MSKTGNKSARLWPRWPGLLPDERKSIADPRLDGFVPDFVRHFTSQHVIDTEHAVRTGLAVLVQAEVRVHTGAAFVPPEGLDAGQKQACAAITGAARLVVVEGAAGSGKTTVLAAAKTGLEVKGRSMVVVAPTLKAAQEAQAATGAEASSVHYVVVCQWVPVERQWPVPPAGGWLRPIRVLVKFLKAHTRTNNSRLRRWWSLMRPGCWIRTLPER